MRAISQLLIIFGLFCALAVYMRFRNRTADRALASFAFVAFALIVIFPDVMTTVAHAVGIGRGVDLVFYFLGTLGIFLVTLLYGKTQRLERQLTLLARHVALTQAAKPPAESSRITSS